MTTTPKYQTSELAEGGWRREIITNPDATTDYIQVPLTSEEFLHPQEGYHLPNSTFHDNAAGDAKDMLTRRYAKDPETAVFRDLVIKWDIPRLRDRCLDVYVVFGVKNKAQNRTEFVVAQDGARPCLIMEVVSPRYRKEDRQIKVQQYAQASVQEYVMIDCRTQRGQVI
ncbi:Uma2 family endonuclease [Microseira sp. BLCC-F43]|jgi:Uma2 family endonuclease|uniref:Uma2 family endonuclease n=1 Tax=Microseira sp. BLCC-F43 TaxID=3153602 RepID=UPI0035BB6CC0